MKPRRLVLLVVSVLGLALGGCASLRHGSDVLSVNLVDVRPLESHAFESSLVLAVRVTNSGPEPLRLSGARHRLTVNGRELGIALNAESVEVPGLSTVVQEATFNLSHLALIPLANELRREPVAVYKIESKLFGGGFLSRGFEVRESGRVDLSALAQAPGSVSGR